MQLIFRLAPRKAINSWSTRLEFLVCIDKVKIPSGKIFASEAEERRRENTKILLALPGMREKKKSCPNIPPPPHSFFFLSLLKTQFDYLVSHSTIANIGSVGDYGDIILVLSRTRDAREINNNALGVDRKRSVKKSRYSRGASKRIEIKIVRREKKKGGE